MLKYYSLSVHDFIIFAIQENWTQMAVSLHVKRVLSYIDGNSRPYVAGLKVTCSNDDDFKLLYLICINRFAS